jgi:23S rRNA G2445 N2-methylase RlmL
LRAADEKGDLLLRIRPSSDGGWETLVRLTPRPLVTRAWRVCNYEASLNATVAHVMALLTQPQAEECFVNLGCGSGTLLIERLSAKRAACLVGIDSSAQQLACTAANLAASGRHDAAVTLLQADMTRTSLAAAIADAVCADLPFGQKVGSHKHNQTLYPRVLAEAARITRTGGRLVLITHEIRLMEQLAELTQDWLFERQIRVTLRGLHPAIYVLRRMP